MTKKLQNLFLLSIPLFIAHGAEEIFTGFYKTDSQVGFWLGNLNSLPTAQATFILLQIAFALMLIIGYLLLLGPQWQVRMMFIPAIIFIYELQHLYKAFDVGGYYSGLMTAILLYMVGFFFWRELLVNWKR